MLFCSLRQTSSSARWYHTADIYSELQCMTPGPPTIFPQHTLFSPSFLSLSSQKPSENGNKKPQLRVGWEWTALRQTNLSLLCICRPQHSLFSHRLPLSLPDNQSCCSYTSQIFSPSLSVGRRGGHVLKDAKKKKKKEEERRRNKHGSLWVFAALTFRQLPARQPGGETCCRALLWGQFHRTIAHITP